jgi:hypothetical protein
MKFLFYKCAKRWSAFLIVYNLSIFFHNVHDTKCKKPKLLREVDDCKIRCAISGDLMWYSLQDAILQKLIYISRKKV